MEEIRNNINVEAEELVEAEEVIMKESKFKKFVNNAKAKVNTPVGKAVVGTIVLIGGAVIGAKLYNKYANAGIDYLDVGEELNNVVDIADYSDISKAE